MESSFLLPIVNHIKERHYNVPEFRTLNKKSVITKVYTFIRVNIFMLIINKFRQWEPEDIKFFDISVRYVNYQGVNGSLFYKIINRGNESRLVVKGRRTNSEV